MKKTLILILSLIIAATAAGCKKDTGKSVETSGSAVSSETDSNKSANEPETSEKKSENKAAESSQAETKAEQPESAENTETEISEKTDSPADSSSQDGNSETVMEIDAYEIYQSGAEMYRKVLLSCPYKLDYDSMDANGFVLISDTSVTKVDDIVSLYCTVFAEPDSYIYERYTEHDGRVYCNDTSRGANIYYTGTDLEYVSGDGAEMTFNAVSHYSDPETGEAMEDKTAAFTIKLVNGSYKITEFDYPK